MSKYEILLKGFGRNFGGHTEIIYKSDVYAWEKASTILKEIEFYEKTKKISIVFDWSQVLESVKESYRIESMSKEELNVWDQYLSQKI